LILYEYLLSQDSQVVLYCPPSGTSSKYQITKFEVISYSA